MRSKLKYSSDPSINEIIHKCKKITSQNLDVDQALFESSIKSLILEAIDEADIKKVSLAIDKSEGQLLSILEYFDSLGDFDKSKIPTVMTYLESLIDALKKARGELASASFDAGAISSFFGQKLTLPQITQAAISIQTKALDFGSGFSKAVQNIANNLGPVITDQDLSVPLVDLAGNGSVPEEDKLRSGIKKAMKLALGGGFFQKVTTFFTKSMSGAEKKIMDSIPDFDANVVADEIAEAFMTSPMKSFFESDFPDPIKPESGMSDIAQESQEQESQSQDKETAAPPPPTPKEAEKEQDQASEELRSAVESESQNVQAPGVAVTDAIEAWFDGLSKSSQQQISQANRYNKLKSTIKTTMDGAAQAVEDSVRSAISDWRSENEEVLVRSKRFAKKNFDSLEKIVPQLASFMIKKVDESTGRLNSTSIKKVVYELLDRRFYKESSKILTSSKSKYTEEDMIVYRLNKLAGLDI